MTIGKSELKEKIKTIKKEIMSIKSFRAGSISKQYNVCGKENCKCKDPENPVKHGPYYQLSYTINGKHSTKFVKEHQVQTVKKEIENHQKLKLLIKELISLSTALSNRELTERK